MLTICPRCLQQRFINDFQPQFKAFASVEKVIFLRFNFCKPKGKREIFYLRALRVKRARRCAICFIFICRGAQHAYTHTNSLKENKSHVSFKQRQGIPFYFLSRGFYYFQLFSLARLTLIIEFIVEKRLKGLRHNFA